MEVEVYLELTSLHGHTDSTTTYGTISSKIKPKRRMCDNFTLGKQETHPTDAAGRGRATSSPKPHIPGGATHNQDRTQTGSSSLTSKGFEPRAG